MKQLNKIYVPIIDMGVEAGGGHLAATWWNRDKSAEHPEHLGVVEYISKDAIIKILNHEKSLRDRYAGDAESIELINALISRINSL